MSITERISDYLINTMDCEPDTYEDRPDVLYTRAGSEELSWNQHIAVREEDRQFIIFGIVPRTCPRNQLRRVAYALNLINDRRVCGCFSVNIPEGGIEYRIGIDLLNVPDEAIEALFYNAYMTAASEVERWMDAIHAVMDGAHPVRTIREELGV